MKKDNGALKKDNRERTAGRGVKQDKRDDSDDKRQPRDSKRRRAKLATARKRWARRVAKMAIARERWASLFGDLVRATMHFGGSAGEYRPRCDIQATNERMLVSVDLPGVSKESITINVENWTLTVRGRRGPAETGNDQAAGEHTVEHRECEHGPFERTIQLDRNADVSRLEAAYEHGVLRVLVPRRGPETIQDVPIGDDAEVLRWRWDQPHPPKRATWRSTKVVTRHAD